MPFIVVGLMVLLLMLAFLFTMLFVARHMSKVLAGTFKVSALPRPVTRSLKDSRRYAQLIVRTAQQYPPGPLRDRLNLTLKSVEQWLANLARLEQGLAKLYSQRNLARELRQTDLEIDKLRRQLLTAAEPEMTFLRELMQSKKQHLTILKELQRFQMQAELKIHKIASDLGAAHAEMLLVTARGDFNENRFRRLDENLQEHLSSMKDMLGAMEDLGYYSMAG